MGPANAGTASRAGNRAPGAAAQASTATPVCPSTRAQQAVHVAAVVDEPNKDSRIAYAHDRAAEALRDGFGRLPHSADEVKAVARQYCAAHPDETVEVDTGTEASKARLMSLDQPPRYYI